MKRGTLKGRDKGRSRCFLAAFEAILARKDRPLNRTDLSRDLGISPSLISLLLSADRHPTPAFVGRLCRHREISSDEALDLITAHLRDVAEEAFPQKGRLQVKAIDITLDDQRIKAAS
jgi:transcriptional regulator with XRE-family HTH domain